MGQIQCNFLKFYVECNIMITSFEALFIRAIRFWNVKGYKLLKLSLINQIIYKILWIF